MFTFDFELFEQPLDASDYATPSPWVPAFVIQDAAAEIIGRDAMGGVYVWCEFAGARTRLLHIDTLGHAALLGEDLMQALALVIALPYWHQLLLECPSAGIDAMHELAQHLEREVCEDLSVLPAARADLQSFLGLPVVSDPVRRLQELALEQGEPYQVLSPHGWRYTSPIAHAAATP